MLTSVCVYSRPPVRLLYVQSVKPWSWTSSVRQSCSLSRPSPSRSSPTARPPIPYVAVETSSARDRTPALNLCLPAPPLRTAPSPVRPWILAGKTQTPVRCSCFFWVRNRILYNITFHSWLDSSQTLLVEIPQLRSRNIIYNWVLLPHLKCRSIPK